MTRRFRAPSRAIVAALVALLALGIVGLTGCTALDPDGGATVPMNQYAPPGVKDAVLESLRAQGYAPDNPNAAYVTYASETETGTATVSGTFYGPGKEKGVLAPYKEIRVTVQSDGTWKVTAAVAGVAPPEAKAEGAGEGEAPSEGAESATAGASTETTQK